MIWRCCFIIANWLRDNILYPHPRIQRGVRILKYHLQAALGSSNLHTFKIVCNIFIKKLHGTFINAEQTCNKPCNCTFAGTRFSNKSKCFSCLDRKGNIFNSMKVWAITFKYSLFKNEFLIKIFNRNCYFWFIYCYNFFYFL
mgnify:CR=1 FL=1